MSVPFFHFGQSSSSSQEDYFIYIGNSTKAVLSSRLNPPSGWDDALSGGTVRWFAFNQNTEWFSVIQLMGGVQVDWESGLGSDKDVGSFLKNNKTIQTRVVFGPGKSCLCWTLKQPSSVGGPRTQGRWNSTNQKDAMDKVLSNQFGAASTIPIRFIALGVDGSYYIKYEDNDKQPVVELGTKYPALKDFLNSTQKPNVDFLALHPYNPDQYFLVLSNGNIRARVSKSIKNQLQKVLSQETDRKVDIDTVS